VSQRQSHFTRIMQFRNRVLLTLTLQKSNNEISEQCSMDDKESVAVPSD
jgi:hypothetical protein